MKHNDIIMKNKIFIWMALVTGAILLIPLIAMQFSNEVVWNMFDFVVAGTLLFGAGSLFVFLARRTTKYRLTFGTVLTVSVLHIWAELAVGILTNWGS